MAIKEILGFDDFPEATRRPTIELLGKGLLPATNGGATSVNHGVMMHDGRQWLKNSGYANPFVRISTVTSNIYTLEEVKTKKLWFGFRYVIPNNPTSMVEVPFVGVYFNGPNALFSPVMENDLQRSTDQAYIEVLVDVAGGKIDSYLDGAFVRSTSIATLTVESITDLTINYGQTSVAGTGENHLFNDFYWIADTTGTDTHPSTRLGPIKVKSVAVDGSVLPEDWTMTEGQTSADDVLLPSTMAPTTERTPIVKTSAAETVASIGFAKPAAELSIKAVSVEIFAFRDTGTAPTLQAQLKQGEKTGDKETFTVPTLEYNRGSKSDRLGCLNTDLNGAEWTNEKIDQLEVLVNSKTGG